MLNKKVLPFIIVMVLILICILPVSNVFADSTTLLAGVAKMQITPEEDTYTAGYGVPGDSANLCVIANGDVLDNIYAKILVLQDSVTGKKVLFITTDTCFYQETPYWTKGINGYYPATVPSGTRQRFANDAGTDLNSVFICYTHDHQASDHLAEKYLQRIDAGIATAISNLRPVNVGYATSTDTLGAERRPDYGVHTDIPIDNRVTVVRFTNATGDYAGYTMATIVNYPVHNTSYNGLRGDRKCFITKELTGYAMEYLEQAYGYSCVSFFFQGCCGDVGPNINGSTSSPDYNSGVTFGQNFGARMKALLDSTSQQPVTVLDSMQVTQTVATKSGWGEQSEPVMFSGARIGNIGFIGVNGEVLQDLGKTMKDNSPFPVTLAGGYCNDYRGYMPSYNDCHDSLGGTYEIGDADAFGDTIGQVILDNSANVLNSLWGGSGGGGGATPTPPPSGSGYIGYNTVGSTSDSNGTAGDMAAFKFTSSSNFIATQMHLYLQSAATGRVKCAIYSD